eukprot:Nitzschia sp. Nitz4//scaffold89_size161592//87763//89271//NITZ4_002383-RA/size161592-processed-gene-0.48-mRNA-1//-1//CDS//3329559631//9006//frame0
MNKFFEQTKKAASKARQAGISNLNAASTALSSASGTNINLTTAKTDDELKRILTDMPVRFAGTVWKRRGGLAKLGSYTNAWESRYLQLRGSILLYFDSDPTKALSSSNDLLELLRGYIDLAQEQASVQVSFGHSGAPSPFCLSIKVQVGLTQETKWKLCMEHHQAQMEWLAAISDVTVQCSVDSYNKALLEAANPSNHGPVASDTSSGTGFLRSPPVYEPGAKDKKGSSSHTPARTSFQLTHQLWMLDEYTIERKTTQTEDQQRKAKASVDTALQVMERLLADERSHHATAAQRLKETEGELKVVQQAKEELETQLQKAVADNKSLEEELSVRISTHSLGDVEAPPKESENEELKEQIDTLHKQLETKSISLQELQDDLETTRTELEERAAELETRVVILQTDKDELEQKLSQLEQAKQQDGETSWKVTFLEEQLETAKKEYQESLEDLAADYARNLHAAEEEWKKKLQQEQPKGTEPRMVRPSSSFSEEESMDEFEDCVED